MSASRHPRGVRMPALCLAVMFSIGCTVPRWGLAVRNDTSRPIVVDYLFKNPAIAEVGPGSTLGVQGNDRFDAVVRRSVDDGYADLARVEAVQDGGVRTPCVVVFEEGGVFRVKVQEKGGAWRVLPAPAAPGRR